MTSKSKAFLSSFRDLMSITSYTLKELESVRATHHNKYVIFDFDGTLADTYQLAIDHLNQLGKKYNLMHVSALEFRDYPLKEALKRAGVKWYQIYDIVKEFKNVMAGKAHMMKPYTGLIEQLHQLKQDGYRLGIMTSNSTVLVESFLIKHQIDLFDFIYSGSSLFAKNRLIRTIRYRLGTPKILYIGDEVRDIQAMHKAQVPLITVSWGWDSPNLLASYRPEILIETVGDLRSAVAKMLPFYT